MSNNADSHDHTSNIARSSRMKLGWIIRTFQTRDRTTMLTLWKELVIPILDYCSQLWSRGQKLTSEILRVNYWERLSRLKLYSLER